MLNTKSVANLEGFRDSAMAPLGQKKISAMARGKYRKTWYAPS